MRIELDRDACQVHGQCAFIAPSVFSLSDDGPEYPEYPSAEYEEDVRNAAISCPVQAIGLIE